MQSNLMLTHSVKLAESIKGLKEGINHEIHKLKFFKLVGHLKMYAIVFCCCS